MNGKSPWGSGQGASGSSNGGGGGGSSAPAARESVVWSERMSEYLIDALLHQQAVGNRKDGRFLTVAFQNVINGVGERFGVVIDRSNIKNRLKSIKDNFHECENLFYKESGFKWSAVTKKFHAEPHVWRDLLERKPEAKKWMTKSIDHYDRLLELFGKDNEKRPAVESPKATPKKKARKETPKEKPQRTPPSNGLESPVVKSSKQSSKKTVKRDEVPSEAVTEKNIAEELYLSEKCKTENGIVAIPVPANAYGKGLPYAPENWPCDGDEWYWKVGGRPAATGHWVDRYLTPPSRFRDATGKKSAFTSRLKVEEFIKTKFPHVDPSTFFSTFIWKIPVAEHSIETGTQQVELHEPERELADPGGLCKARNKLCNLEREGFIESSPAQECGACCKLAGFCRECCCVFCRKVIDYSVGGYTYIKCEAVLEENYICGHRGHIDCALRVFMAGTVGGSIGLDVQYFCRRCDNKTNLMMHVEKFLEICQSLESRDEIEPILNLGLCVLRGSRQTKAKRLEKVMGSAMAKLKSGVDLAEVWKMEDNDDMVIPGAGETTPATGGVTVLGVDQAPEDVGFPYYVDSFVDNELQRAVENLPVIITGDQKAMSVKYENEIDDALQELKKSQEAEYMLAEQKLYSQKDHILSLYRQLESERSELEDPSPLSDNSKYDILISNVVKRAHQVKREVEKFEEMMKVAKGFGKTPSNITQEHFGLSADN